MLATAIRAAREAGRILLALYRQPHQVSSKGLRDISTEADLAAERAVMDIVRAECPDARFCSEETANGPLAVGDGPVWYIDPLDGTTNYARGLPMFCVSIAMARAGVVQCGVVFDPLVGDLFAAQRGQGTTLNGQPLRVSERATLGDATVLVDWPRDQLLRERNARMVARLAPQVDSVRSRGCAAQTICCVAAGWAEAYFQYTLQPWDVAAGVLILEEAGGRVTDLAGRPAALHQRDWLCTNGLIHEALLALDPLSA
ncbi:MAG: inositol monophosphatase [Chloroflexi bacterium]|nr:inositol monophosphatase [Chloroflexota bacterium]